MKRSTIFILGIFAGILLIISLIFLTYRLGAFDVIEKAFDFAIDLTG